MRNIEHAGALMPRGAGHSAKITMKKNFLTRHLIYVLLDIVKIFFDI
jgi:hypothetical protein